MAATSLEQMTTGRHRKARVAAGTTTVRVSTETHEKLRSLADEDSLSIQEVLDRAVEWYRRHVFLEKANEEYARLRADPQAWEEELAERRLLEGTLMDGLEDEPPYPLTEEEQQAVDEWRARQRRA